MMIAFGSVADWAVVAGMAVNSAATVLMLVMRSQFATNAALARHAGTVDEIAEHAAGLTARVDAVEKKQAEEPDVHELSRQIARLQGNVETLQAQIAGLNNTIERVERPLEMLLEHQLKSGR